MSQIHHYSTPPSWEELKLAMASDATADLRNEMETRLKVTTPSDEAVLGARDFLEDHGYDFDALRNFINPHQQPSAEKKKAASIIKTSFLKISAAAMLLAALAYGGINLLEAQRHRKMTDIVFYEPGMPVFAGITGDKLFQEMMTSFRLEECSLGLQYIDTLERRYGQNDTLSYYAGWLYYFDHAYPSAASRFEVVRMDTSSIYQEKADLMSAAAHCLAGQKNKARNTLEAILKKPQHNYRKEAERMLIEENL